MKPLGLLICCLTLVLLLPFLFGCTPSDSVDSVNITLNGVWMTHSGEIIGEDELSIRGELPNNLPSGENRTCTLDLVWLKDLENLNSDLDQRCVFSPSEAWNLPYCVICSELYYDADANSAETGYLLFFPKEGMACYAKDNFELFFVASTDTSADSQHLLQYYSDILYTIYDID
ncbi:MAG: hypothetical protein E7462_01675 [Ruminococcaceae bacterium]|nr:hypothetical protein [Oscillospiraceae bacterium]